MSNPPEPQKIRNVLTIDSGAPTGGSIGRLSKHARSSDAHVYIGDLQLTIEGGGNESVAVQCRKIARELLWSAARLDAESGRDYPPYPEVATPLPIADEDRKLIEALEERISQ